MREEQIIEEIVSKSDKYCSLVWFSRSRPENIDIPGEASKEASYVDAGVRQGIERVLKQYPDDANDLSSDSGDWHHGFNSGMLAGMRYKIVSL